MNTFNTPKTEKTTNVWLTPRYVLDLLGQFDVDPCADIMKPSIFSIQAAESKKKDN